MDSEPRPRSAMFPYPPLRALSLGLMLAAGCAASAAQAPPVGPETRPPALQAAAVPPKSEPAPEAAAPDASDAPASFPTECAPRTDGVCVPPRAFVERLCSGAHPDVALSMFAKGTPWSRGYATRDVEAWSASVRTTSSGMLELDEEVLLLAHRGGGASAMQVSGSESYDVLRWDGSCASLMSDELTRKPPPKAKHARIPWRRLDARVRDALVAEQRIGKVDTERRKECKGAGGFGGVTPECSRVDERLSVVVVEYIRAGGAIPPPETVP